MTTRWLHLGVMLLAGALPGSLCWAGPSREDIVAYAEDCKVQKKRMDLIAKFGRDFTKLDLSGVDFRGHYYVNNETILTGANFSGADLRNADFGSARLDGANFTGANLEGASFVTATLRGAILRDVRLKGASFYQSDLSNARLAGADLSQAHMTGSSFAGADLAHAVLAGARNDYWWSDFAGADLTGADLRGLKLNGARFQGATLRDARLDGCSLKQANFQGADLTGAGLQDVDVDAAVFAGVRGLDPEEEARLVSQAQRWKFDLWTGLTGFLHAAWPLAYLLVVLALAGLTIPACPTLPAFIVPPAFLNALALLPPGFLLFMLLAGGSPVVQFNAGNPQAMSLWSAWVGLGPLCALGLLGGLMVVAGYLLLFLALHLRWSAFKKAWVPFVYLGLTVLHFLLACHFVFGNMPTA